MALKSSRITSFVPISDIMSSKRSSSLPCCALFALSLNVSPEVVGDLLVVTPLVRRARPGRYLHRTDEEEGHKSSNGLLA
jgi:hypothetical protein